MMRRSDAERPASLRLVSGCKLNLYLRITGVREDGYHLLESLLLPLSSPCDTLVLEPGEAPGLTLRCDDASLPVADNTIARAFRAFAAATGFSPPLSVTLRKGVPHGAGLGGGSGNAAAILLYLNEEAASCGREMTFPALGALAASVGADVPFFLVNRPALVTGIGDRIEERANPAAGLYLVLACPPVRVSTAWAFAAWDKNNPEKDGLSRLTRIREADTKPLVQGLCVENDLCPVVFEEYPELAQIVDRLHGLGAKAASMSGSGSSLFGLFDEERTADRAADSLRNEGCTVFRHIL